jgi:dolichol-phosphate mannosyltransferase
MPVRHHPRKIGQSKYGLERVIKVVLDLIVVKFLDSFFVKPIYVFGGFGILALATSAVCVVLMMYWKIAEGIAMIRTPMPVLAAMTFLVGIISILMGLLAEILVRIYFESQQRTAYSIRSIINDKSGR